MEKKGKHIDEVFRERLSDLNVTPPTDAWSEIEDRVHRRKMILFTVPRLVAASLLLFVLTGSLWLIFLREPSDNGLADQPVFSSHTQKDLSSAEQAKTKNIALPAGENIRKTARPAAKKGSENTTSGKAAKKAKTTPLYSASHTVPMTSGISVVNSKEAPEIVPAIQLAFMTPKNAVVLYKLRNITPALDNNLLNQYIQAESLPVSPVLKKQPGKKGTWGIGGDFGPVYAYRHLSEGSPQIVSYLNAVENGMVSFAGNVSFFYERNRRLTVQSGIGYYRLGQEVNDVVAFRMKKSGELAILKSKGNDFINVSEGKLGYSGTPVFVANRKAPGGNDQVEFLLIRLGADTYEPVDVQLKQELEFVEIPLLLRYKVIDKTMGLNVIGGIGTSVLVKGQTSVISDQGTTLIGDLYELQKTNFNGTFGLGLSYSISTSLRLRLEPVVKYYLNPVYRSPEISTHPYSIGIYSGMSFYF
ncbi:MAG: outer membrane beta-barrel protein [Bacteroidales bacterium]|nr:outer membrane beta-barrel protein [Bacteroidales bacterium]